MKKLISGAQINSCVGVHPKGDNIVVGTHDRRLIWFDLDLANTPYRTLRYHNNSINSVTFNRKYPLFASGSDDGAIHVFHGMVYNDLMQNALIVPLKILKTEKVDEIGVRALEWHVDQPWLFSGANDGNIVLWT